MRLIDADALTEWIIGELRRTPNGVFNDLNGRQVANLIGKAIDEAPTINGWISVKDRLPEESGNVIVCCHYRDSSYYIAIVNFSVKYQKFNVFDNFVRAEVAIYKGFDDVTHWMPMPEPPKEVT